MKHWKLVSMVAALAACAPLPPVAQDERLFNDHLFAAPSEPVDVGDVFALSEPMRRYLDEAIAEPARKRGRQVALVDALYTKSQLKLEYDSAWTRNAAQAFAARSGNCLSLVIMTAAFAKELGLAVEYQQVYVDDAIGRDGDVYMAIGHVNLVLGKRKTDEGGFGHRVGKRPAESEGMVIDFLPPADMRAMRTRPLDEATVVAMFMNNRAVEALARGRHDDAYWWARAGVAQAPGYLPAYNTLGAVYQRHGRPVEAERALAHVLAREPRNTMAMSNLVRVLSDQGRGEESRALAASLQRLDPDPPFAWFIRGMAAMRSGDLDAAKQAFAQEVARAPDYHEFHYWLGIVHMALGENEDARRELAIALKHSTTRRDHDLYAAKLDRLRQPR